VKANLHIQSEGKQALCGQSSGGKPVESHQPAGNRAEMSLRASVWRMLRIKGSGFP